MLLIFNYFHYGGTVNYNPYASNQPHLLHATNTDNDEYNNNAPQSATNDYTVYKQSQQNLQENSNYQQLYRYYYTPPYQQQQMQPPQPTQLWSGPPIVVEDDIQQQQQSSSTANIPPTLYQQHSATSSMLLPSLHRNSKALPLPVYSPQTTHTAQFNYNNNNNNNIVYHRDFRHQIDAIPELQHTTQPDIVSWNNQQQQHQLLEPQQQQQQQQHHHQQQPQQLYATNTNLRYNGISNDNVPDYGEHFKRYLENNPRRIRPIY